MEKLILVVAVVFALVAGPVAFALTTGIGERDGLALRATSLSGEELWREP